MNMKTKLFCILLVIFAASCQSSAPNYEADDLFRAASRGDIVGVRGLLKKGADVNAKNELGKTPLMTAVSGGHTEIVKLLLENKANANVRDGNQDRTILMCAASQGHTEIVGLLLEFGANVNTRSRKGWLADDLELGTFIIPEGRTALYIAAEKGHTNVVKILLEAGADVNAKARNKHTPLGIAKKNGHKKTVKLLKKYDAKD
jgi:ankyrin repeat protein